MAIFPKKSRCTEFASKKDAKFEMPDNGTIAKNLSLLPFLKLS
jgi:hypothetical protein